MNSQNVLQIFYSVYISLCKVFLAGDAGYERTVREDKTDFAWAAETGTKLGKRRFIVVNT